jgi:hypothetical protein
MGPGYEPATRKGVECRLGGSIFKIAFWRAMGRGWVRPAGMLAGFMRATNRDAAAGGESASGLRVALTASASVHSPTHRPQCGGTAAGALRRSSTPPEIGAPVS